MNLFVYTFCMLHTSRQIVVSFFFHNLSVALVQAGHGVQLSCELIACEPSSPADRYRQLIHSTTFVPPYFRCSSQLLLQISSNPGFTTSCCFWLILVSVVLLSLMPALRGFWGLLSLPQAFLKGRGWWRYCFMLSTYAGGRAGIKIQTTNEMFFWQVVL